MRFFQNLYCQIFRPKLLHRQFHLILAVLVIKTQKMIDKGEIYTAGRNFTLLSAVTGETNFTFGWGGTVFNKKWKVKILFLL